MTLTIRLETPQNRIALKVWTILLPPVKLLKTEISLGGKSNRVVWEWSSLAAKTIEGDGTYQPFALNQRHGSKGYRPLRSCFLLPTASASTVNRSSSALWLVKSMPVILLAWTLRLVSVMKFDGFKTKGNLSTAFAWDFITMLTLERLWAIRRRA